MDLAKVGLRTKTVKGIFWTVASQLIRLVVGFVTLAILARFLAPSAFGLMAMAAVFANMFIILNDLGLPSAIIQKKDVTEEHLSSSFWLNLLEGTLVTVILIALAPLIAKFYSNNDLTMIIIVLSFIFAISSIGMIQSAIFSKMLNFKTLAIIEIASSVSAAGVAIVLAVCGFGVWSLVAQSLVSTVIMSMMLFILSKWKPKLIFRWQPVRELLSFGLNLFGFNIVNYLSRNLDNLLIGKVLGARQLGFYDIAYRLLLFPVANVSAVIGRVMFPALSVIQNDKEAVRSAYIRATRYIGTITFPLMAGLIVLAPQLVRVAFGTKWERSIFLIQVLAVVGLLQSIATTRGWIFLSQGRAKALFRLGLALAAVYAFAFLIGLHWNVEGVAVAYAIAVILALYLGYAIAFRYIDLRFWHFARQFLTIALAAGGMASVILGLRFLLEKVWRAGDLTILIVGVVSGSATYLGLLLLFDKGLLRGLVEIIRDLRSD